MTTIVEEGIEMLCGVDPTNISSAIFKLYAFVDTAQWNRSKIQRLLKRVVRYLKRLLNVEEFKQKLALRNEVFREHLVLYLSEIVEIVKRCSKRYNSNVRRSRVQRLRAMFSVKYDLHDLDTEFQELRKFLEFEINVTLLFHSRMPGSQHDEEDDKEDNTGDFNEEEDVVELIAGESDLEQYPKSIRDQLEKSQRFIKDRREQNQSFETIYHDVGFRQCYRELQTMLNDEADRELMRFNEKDVIISKIEDNYLGRGGFGYAWKATLHNNVTSSIGPEVAVKLFDVMRLELQDKQRTQLRQEVQQFLRIDSLVEQARFDHIVRFHGLLEQGMQIGIVMELCHGGSIAKRIHDRSITEEKVVDFSIQIAKGLQFLHEEVHVIHRDLKPANCLLSAQGIVKLADFGMTTTRHESTRAQSTLGGGGLAGTMEYIAPEVYEAQLDKTKNFKTKSGAVDIYALGMTIWSMVTLERPFPDIAITAISEIVRKGRRPPLKHPNFFKSTMSGVLQSIVRGCFNAEPALRPKLCDIIKKLSTGVRVPSESEIREMSVDDLIWVIRAFPQSEMVQENCALAIGNLASYNNQDHINTMMEKNIADDLVQAMRAFPQSEMVQRYCAYAIANLVCNNQDHINTMMEKNIADDLVQAMRAFPQSEMVQRYCALAIGNLAFSNNQDHINTMMEKNVADDLVQAIERFPYSKDLKRYSKIAIINIENSNTTMRFLKKIWAAFT